jgi:glucose/arabinose dehydrogenase
MIRFCLFFVLATTVAAVEPAPDYPGWKNTRLTGTPDQLPLMTAVRAYPKLPVRRPVAVEKEPGASSLLMLQNFAWAEDRTELKRFDDREDATESTLLLSLREMAYTICFHPRYAENGYLYLGQNGSGPGPGKSSRIVRYTVSRQAPWHLVDGSALTIIEWRSDGHNGASAAFGKDGMLYVTSGDGTAQSDGDIAGQDTASMRSKVMRIDVDGAPPGKTYVVPPDNPFMGNPAVRPETWAYGFRNPWRITSDLESGQIWVGQNGQDLREYANLLERGANYGWSVMEGASDFYTHRQRGQEPFVPPVKDHHHSQARSLTGGIVYRGSQVDYRSLVGAYVYGDYSTGKIWAIWHDGKQVVDSREIADTPHAITSFESMNNGEIWIADHLGKSISKLVPNRAEDTSDRFPRLLSQTGLFEDVAKHRYAKGVIPYSVNSPFWSDGAFKQRAFAIPDDASEDPRIEFQNQFGWTFPNGTVLIKSFSLEKQAGNSESRYWIETRLMVREQNEWSGYSYRWNQDGTDAQLVDASGTDVS